VLAACSGVGDELDPMPSASCATACLGGLWMNENDR
jgi:hypothetical protein